MTTFFARYEPRRATAGGTTRTPLARNAASLSAENLGSTLSKKASSPACMKRFSLRRKLSSTAFLTHWLTRPLADAAALGDADLAGVEAGDDLLDGGADLAGCLPGRAKRGLPRRDRWCFAEDGSWRSREALAL